MQTDLRTDAARRGRRAIRRTFVLAAITSLAAAAPAFAAKTTVDYTAGTFTFQAGAGEANKLAVSPGVNTSNFQIYDKALASIALDQVGATTACTLPELYKFRCPQGGLTHSVVALGDGTDTLNYSIALPVTVTAGAGVKTITTGAGDDRIDVRNGSADSVDCGDGNDVVLGDAADTVAGDCELVNSAAPAPGTVPPSGVNDPTGALPTGDDDSGNAGSDDAGGSAPAPDALSSALGLSLPTLTFAVPRPTRAIVPLSCSATAADGCHGEVILTLLLQRAKRHHVASRRVIAARGHFTAQQRHTRRIGRRNFKLAPGQSVKLPVRIVLRGHFAIASRRRNRAKARIEVVQRDAAGKVASVQTRTVTLVLQKNKWSRKRGRR